MKNREKYSKEILEYASSTEKAIAVCKETMKPCDCSATSIRCKNCICSVDDSCENEPLYKWAMAEYIERPKISKKDRAFLDYLIKEYKFIARDRNCKLLICEVQPIKREKYWYLSNGHCLSLNRCLNIDFPMVKWSDDEPWKIEDLKELEVVDEY